MTPDNQPDPIDRTLAALGNATPPEGMEARVLDNLNAARLAARTPSTSRWRILVAQSAWLRGALTGAVVATAACALAFYATRAPRPAPQTTYAGVPHRDEWHEGSTPATSPTRVALNANTACPGTIPGAPPRLRLGGNVASFASRVPRSSPYRDEWDGKSPHLIPASFAPSKPAPPAPLTPQERALIQFARTATPAEMAALHHPSDGQSDADREAAFKNFFAPSPERVAIDEAQGITIDPAKTAPPQPAEVQN